MIYSGNGKSDVLYFEQNDDGTGIVVKNIRGSHPCGYITFPKIEMLNGDYDSLWLENSYAHGGFTFLDRLSKGNEEYFEGFWIGWDYAHYGDYCCYGPDFESEGKMYTTEEIIEEANKMLDDIRNGNYEISTDED